MERDTLLSLEQINAGYGKRKVLHDISMEVQTGDLLAIIGHNGSGKSTLLKVISGFLQPFSGKITFAGDNLTNLATHQRVRRGISYLIQGGKIFPSLTVRENIELSVKHNKRNSSHAQSHVKSVLDLFPELQKLLKTRSGLLSGGERQMLALATILMQRPRLLLLDEPSARLAPILVDVIFERIQSIHKEWSLSIILVEQNVSKALTISTNGMLLSNGIVKEETENTSIWDEDWLLSKF